MPELRKTALDQSLPGPMSTYLPDAWRWRSGCKARRLAASSSPPTHAESHPHGRRLISQLVRHLTKRQSQGRGGWVAVLRHGGVHDERGGPQRPRVDFGDAMVQHRSEVTLPVLRSVRAAMRALPSSQRRPLRPFAAGTPGLRPGRLRP